MRHSLKHVLAKSRAKMTGAHEHEDEAEDREMIDRILAKHEAAEPMAAGGYSGKAQDFISRRMHTYGKGKMHSSSKHGPEVTNPDQALAIALSEARAKGMKVPKEKAHGGEIPYKPHPDYHDNPHEYYMGGYSEGGVQANEGHDELAADAHTNDFDDLVLADELEPHHLNMTDDLDTHHSEEDEREDETTARIMRSMRKRDKLPGTIRLR